jgi:hypothetical protein
VILYDRDVVSTRPAADQASAGFCGPSQFAGTLLGPMRYHFRIREAVARAGPWSEDGDAVMSIVFTDPPATAAAAPEPATVEARVWRARVSERVADWIERFCRVPAGVRAGDIVRLNDAQRDLLGAIYDGVPEQQAVQGDLAAYLALARLAGPCMNDSFPQLETVDAAVWGACCSELQALLFRDERGHIAQAC